MNQYINQTMIVIARKYNDVFYAISTIEWKKTKKHILLIVPNRSSAESFPCTDLFDKCIILPSDKNVSLINWCNYLFKLKNKLRNISGDIIVMSNPEMLFNRIIFMYTCCREIIFIEDGLRNYYNYKASQNIIKKIIEKVYCVSDKNYYRKISTTYLTNPEKAKYYFGNRMPIELDINLPSDLNIPNLSGKRIFVAQDVLDVGEKKINEQQDFFNSLIKKLKIDYYLPRTYDYQEKIEGCQILNLNNKGVTLEFLASKFDIEIFGFTSTLLFSLKMINSKTISHRITSEKTAHLLIPQIIQDNIDYIENIDEL